MDPITLVAVLLTVAGGFSSAATVRTWQGGALAVSGLPRRWTTGSTLFGRTWLRRDLIREINTEFEVQVAAAEKIRAEAEQNQRLAELTDQQARAVKQLVESVQDKASRFGSHQQWLFFLAGLLAAIPVGVLGNFAFELVKTWMATP